MMAFVLDSVGPWSYIRDVAGDGPRGQDGEPEMNTQVETDKKGKKVAEHSWLDASGAVVEDIELATGIRYVDVGSGKTFDYQTGGTAGDKLTMQACFGCRTLATNEASAERQRDGTGAEQVEAIEQRFALQDQDPPVWVDRTREGGPRIDAPTLAQAVVEVLVQAGKVANDDAAKQTAYVGILAKFEDEKTGKAAISKAKSNPQVDAEYKKLRGAKAATTDDLAALV